MVLSVLSVAVTPPRLLVVGGTGRLGRLLRGAWDLRDPGLVPVWQSRHAETPARGVWLTFDPLSDPEAFAAAARAADAVLMLAGVIAGSAAELARNTDLAQAAVRAAAGRPVLLASSAAVYGAGLPPDPARGWAEGDPCTPAAPYGVAKLAMEAACAGAPGLTVLRIGNVAGADALLGQAAPEGGRRLDTFPDGRAARRSYIGPQALARAIAGLARLAAGGIALPSTLNLALPGVVGMEDLLAADAQGWVPVPAPDAAIPEVRLDVTRALDLGVIADTPARAAAIVADLRALAPVEAAA
ncbi:MAG: NAD-dependent epimerase/dehydratase family protein [Sphingomonadales bacterium]|nr:NAD-dependent epimerase/dehydratase family protein [Sphingomonadales bacterium]